MDRMIPLVMFVMLLWMMDLMIWIYVYLINWFDRERLERHLGAIRKYRGHSIGEIHEENILTKGYS